MFVKVINKIPYYADSEEGNIDVPQDNMVYFEVISNHFLRGLVLRMDDSDFRKRFTNRPNGKGLDNHGIEKPGVYSSCEWLFYDKVLWWNSNIKEVEGCIGREELEYVDLYNNICNEYCDKFKVAYGDFLADHKFFDNMLSEVHINSSGKVSTYKKRKNKPLRNKACSVCGGPVKGYEISSNGKIVCEDCNMLGITEIEETAIRKFEEQWIE